MLYTSEPTILLYMTDTSAQYIGSEIVDIFLNEDGRKTLILDKSIFYPQGGGQQYDLGTIENENCVFEVSEVRFVDGLVHHIGNFVSGSLNIGDIVNLSVNIERRELNSKLQSAGHLIDIALRNIGFKDITPLKGYHFPDGPYVEYIGDVDSENIKEKLQSEINRLTESGYEVIILMSNIEEAKKVCYFFPSHIPEGKPIRIVSVWNNEFIPCGGTHVSNISQLKGLTIKEIKNKKGNTRVSYTM